MAFDDTRNGDRHTKTALPKSVWIILALNMVVKRSKTCTTIAVKGSKTYILAPTSAVLRIAVLLTIQALTKYGAKDAKKGEPDYSLLLDDTIDFVQALRMPGKNEQQNQLSEKEKMKLTLQVLIIA